jgi:hypothetical protein
MRKLRANFVKMLDDLKELENGGFESYGEKHNWTHKSCLYELPYAKTLILPHNIDLMYQERNVAKIIISMCFDVTNFSKYNINSWKDLVALCSRPMSTTMCLTPYLCQPGAGYVLSSTITRYGYSRRLMSSYTVLDQLGAQVIC